MAAILGIDAAAVEAVCRRVRESGGGEVVAANLNSNDIVVANSVETLNGQAIYPSLLVDDASLQVKNIYCNNGVIHVIDNVILPKTEI